MRSGKRLEIIAPWRMWLVIVAFEWVGTLRIAYGWTVITNFSLTSPIVVNKMTQQVAVLTYLHRGSSIYMSSTLAMYMTRTKTICAYVVRTFVSRLWCSLSEKWCVISSMGLIVIVYLYRLHNVHFLCECIDCRYHSGAGVYWRIFVGMWATWLWASLRWDYNKR